MRGPRFPNRAAGRFTWLGREENTVPRIEPRSCPGKRAPRFPNHSGRPSRAPVPPPDGGEKTTDIPRVAGKGTSFPESMQCRTANSCRGGDGRCSSWRINGQAPARTGRDCLLACSSCTQGGGGSHATATCRERGRKAARAAIHKAGQN
jgi:hypothetical protein